jgi:hypothetical protein
MITFCVSVTGSERGCIRVKYTILIYEIRRDDVKLGKADGRVAIEVSDFVAVLIIRCFCQILSRALSRDGWSCAFQYLSSLVSAFTIK